MKNPYSWHKDTDERWPVRGPGFYMIVDSEQEATTLAAALGTAYNSGVKITGKLYVVSMLLNRSESTGWHGRLWQQSVVADSKMAAAGTAVFAALEEREHKGFSVRSIGVISIADELDPTALPGPIEDGEEKEGEA